MTVPPGLSIAFDDTALEASPTWTRIDNVTGVKVQRIQVKRGRPDERSKTSTGTVTATGVDSSGALDPTNPSSPFYAAGATKLDPVKQAAVSLFNPETAAWSMIFRGHVADWTYDLDPSAKFFRWQLDLVDVLDILDDVEMIPDQAGNTVPAESTGDVYYNPATVQDRILALLADAAAFGGGTWPSDLAVIFSGNVNVQGTVYAPRTPIREGIDEACDAEFPGVANRYAAKTGELTFHGRYARFNPDDVSYGIQKWKVGDLAAFAGDGDTAVFTQLKFSRGKTNLINAALVTPKGIANTDIAGQFATDATSVSKYAPRSVSYENLITGDSNPDGNDALQENLGMATYWKDNYATPRTRVSQVVFRNPPTSRTVAQVWAVIVGIELNDILRVTTTHPGGGGFTNDDNFVENLAYDLVPHRGDVWDVTLTVGTSPRAYYDTNPFPS